MIYELRKHEWKHTQSIVKGIPATADAARDTHKIKNGKAKNSCQAKQKKKKKGKNKLRVSTHETKGSEKTQKQKARDARREKSSCSRSLTESKRNEKIVNPMIRLECFSWIERVRRVFQRSKTWVEATRYHKLSSPFHSPLPSRNTIFFTLCSLALSYRTKQWLNSKTANTQKHIYSIKESWITFFKCLLTHFVKVFFWIASRSSVEKERKEFRENEKKIALKLVEKKKKEGTLIA